MTKIKFNVVYAGNIGYVQDVDVVLATAKLITNKYIVFHVFGEGSQSKRIKNRIVDEKLSNVFFYDPVDVAQSGHIYNSAQLNIISILPGIIKTALPLKTASVLTANIPFVFIGVGEAVNEPFLINNPNFHGIDNRDYYSLAKVIERE